MRFMVLVPANEKSEAGELPPPELLAAMHEYNEQLVQAGIMLAGDGLHPTSRGARVVFDGAKRTVQDGPFAESKELVAGYWIWEVRSREEAVEWLKRAPFGNHEGGPVSVELRQIFDADDFAPADPTGELRQKEAELRARVSAEARRRDGE
jgi:hypothetical protein